jgi:hypothetical protein
MQNADDHAMPDAELVPDVIAQCRNEGDKNDTDQDCRWHLGFWRSK